MKGESCRQLFNLEHGTIKYNNFVIKAFSKLGRFLNHSIFIESYPLPDIHSIHEHRQSFGITGMSGPYTESGELTTTERSVELQ